MTVTRWAISLQKELAKEIKRSAAGQPISTWLADAARSKLRFEGMLAAVAAWEKEHGKISDEDAAAVWARHEQALRTYRPRRKRRR